MTKINLPKDIPVSNSLKALPAKEKEEYIHNLLKKLLDINPDGITTSQIKESLGLTPSTTWHHLEVLKSTAQCRKISHGNLDVYHTYGKEEELAKLETPKNQFTLEKVENEAGIFICIHDRRKNRRGIYTVVSGIAIPVEMIDDIIKALEKVKILKKS